eukprot:511522_1
MAQPVVQTQQVFVQYVDQYGNPIPVVPMQQTQAQPQQMAVFMPQQAQQHNASIASASSIHSNSALSFNAPAPRQIPLQIQQPVPQTTYANDPSAPQNVARSIQIQQQIPQHASSDRDHPGTFCCVFQCTQLTAGICRKRFCGDECCRPHSEKHCFRPGGDEDVACICCVIYLLLFCCVWEALYNCLVASICRTENKWCCIPCDLFVNLLLFIPLGLGAIVADILCIVLALLACALDPICCLITCNGEFCKWKIGHNALCCITLGWYEDAVTQPKEGCWEKECGDDCGYFYCYRLRCDNWSVC